MVSSLQITDKMLVYRHSDREASTEASHLALPSGVWPLFLVWESRRYMRRDAQYNDEGEDILFYTYEDIDGRELTVFNT